MIPFSHCLEILHGGMHPYPSDPCEVDCRCPQSVPVPSSVRPSTLHPPRTTPSRQTTDLPAINNVNKSRQPTRTPPVIPRTKTAPPIHVRGALTKSPVFTKPLPIKTAPFKPPELKTKPSRPRPIKTAPPKAPQKRKAPSNLPMIKIQPVKGVLIQGWPTRYPSIRTAPLGRHLVTFANLAPEREEPSPEEGPTPLIEIVLPRARSCDVICRHHCDQVAHYEGFSNRLRLRLRS